MIRSEQGVLQFYPESEPKLEEWESTLLAEGPTTIVKLAFRSLNSLRATKLWEAVASNDFDKAGSHIWANAHDSQHFLSNRRHATNNGHRFVRMHATSASDEISKVLPHRPPHFESPYWRTISMFFTHLNGPLAGEESYAIPEALDRKVGLSRQANETIVLLSQHGEARGASSVQYNLARTKITQRTFFEPHHPVTMAAGRIANTLLAHNDLASMRMSVVEPPSSVQTDVGLRALSLPYIKPTGFIDLLPPALRQAQSA